MTIHIRTAPYVRTGRTLFYSWRLKESEVLAFLKAWPDLSFGEDGKAKNYFDLFKLSETATQAGFPPAAWRSPKQAERLAHQKVKTFFDHFCKHPALVTLEMKEIIDKSATLTEIMGTKTIKIIPAGDNQQAVIVENTNDLSPLVKMETIKADIQEGLLDRLQAVLNSMTGQKIGKANLGTLSKSLENLMKSYTMFKGETTPKSFLQININQMNLQQKKELSLKLGDGSRQSKSPVDIKK